MLYYETIDAKTLELLTKLQSIKAFSGLRFVGGTALALQLGHRKSVDIDLFGKLVTDEFELADALSPFKNVTILNRTKNINIYI